MLLGCIGDDFTGSSDLANTLAKAGMAVVQYRYDRVELAPAFGGKKMLIKVCECGYHLHLRRSL